MAAPGDFRVVPTPDTQVPYACSTPMGSPSSRCRTTWPSFAIEQDTHRLLEEARANSWDGEVLALETTLAAVAEKKAQVERIRLVTGTPAGSRDSKQTVWLTIGPSPVSHARAAEHHAAVVSRPKG